MASKKDFKTINTSNVLDTERVKADVEQSARKSRQTTASPEEQAKRQAELRTQGRKGCKASTRINMIFTPENREYVEAMAQMTGQTMTRFINSIIKQHKLEHQDTYEYILKARNMIEESNKDIIDFVVSTTKQQE